MTKHFGEHLMVDGYEGSEELLNNKELVLECLEQLPKFLGMTVLREPDVVFAPGNDKKDPGGWSGFVIIAESHVSIHTFPRRGFISADIYTCQAGLDVEMVRSVLVDL